MKMRFLMRLESTLQRVSLIWRFLLIFSFCVLIPFAIVLTLSLTHLEAELKQQAFQRLRFQTKTTALSILDRLHHLAAEMRFLATHWEDAREKRSASLLQHESDRLSHFETLIIKGPQGMVALHGDAPGDLSIPPEVHGFDRSRKPIIFQENGTEDSPQLWMALALPDSEFIIGRINTGYVWNEDANFNLPSGNEICVIGSADNVLVSSLPMLGNLAQVVANTRQIESSGELIWQNAMDVYLATVYPLFLESSFSNTSWNLVLSRPQRTISAPIQKLEMNLILTGLLAVLVVLLLSSISIRRTLKPLNHLVTQAESLGNGDFSVKADIKGSPEIQELGHALNAMAGQIEKQFKDLRENEAQFRIAFDNSAVGMALVSLDGRFIRVNSFLADMLGFSKKDLSSKSLREIVYSEPSDDSDEKPLSILSNKPLDQSTEFRFCHRDSRIVHGLVNSTLLHGGLGEPIHYIVHIQDITRQREMAELKSAREKADIANRTKSEFLASMSHELRTPLNHIIGFTELIATGIAGEVNDQQKEYLNDVLQSSHHLLSLVNDILDLAKVESGKLKLELSDIDIRSLLENSMVMIKEKALKHGIELSVIVNGVPDTIRADERKLKQIMYNLLSNAVKFTPAGGKISVAAQACHAESEALFPLGGAPDGYIQISVSDNGIGLKADDLDRIFQPFEQAATPGQTQIQGTGLGLSLTRQLVELHGGKIWAQSEGVRKGAAFYLTLPA